MRLLSLGSAVVLLLTASPVAARDWFVRAGSAGDGTQAKPFGDPWEALERCTAGDKIHVAQGEYFGKMEAACWEIPFANVQLLGGYSADFRKRNPWTMPSHLTWKAGSKNKCTDGRVHGGKDHAGAVLDGFVLDMQAENRYADDTLEVRMHPNATIVLDHPGVIIRNNVILNSGDAGIRARGGMTVENNVVVNSIVRGIWVGKGSPVGGKAALSWGKQTSDLGPPVVVRNNTVLFTWDEKSPARGGSRGIDLETDAETLVEGNILAHADNHGLCVYRGAAPKVTLKGNVFHMNLFANVKLEVEGQDVGIDNSTMEMLEEVGFKALEGNSVADPGFRYDPKWLDLFSKREAAQLGKVTMDDWNKTRSLLGLPTVGKGGKAAKNFAPPWKWQDAVALTAPGNKALQAGARAKDLPVELAGGAPSADASPQRDYAKTAVADWARNAEAVDGKPVEVKVAVGGVVAPRGLGTEVGAATHGARFLHDAEKTGEKIYGYYAKGSQAERVVEAAGYWTGGPVARPYVVRGIARVVKNVPKAGIFIESIEPFEQAAAPAKERPAGRDWFVSAGAKGDGSKEKPFKALYQALKAAGPGDRIHVAAGEYQGFLNKGNWKIDKPYLALYGGYSADFSGRDPWKNPTLLVWKAGKTKPNGPTLEGGTEPHEGLILDGFVFDRQAMNKYKNGDLEFSMSPAIEHVWVNAKDVTIRNCVFVNGAGRALRLTGEQVVENNIFVNHIFGVIDLTATNETGAPSLFRHNTLVFSWNRNERAGMPDQASGYGLLTRIAKARVEKNIFAFMDNHGIKVESEARDLEVVGNVFSHNQFDNVMYRSKHVIDDKTMPLLEQVGFKEASGNKVQDPRLPIDPKWFDLYSQRSAGVPGKVTMDDWNQLRAILGQPLLATGGTAGTIFAPAYDWKKALELFPQEKGIDAGARRGGAKVEWR